MGGCGYGLGMKALFVLIAISVAAANVSSVSFDQDVAFLKKHTQIIVLSQKDDGAQVAVAPALQGRVMTSTAEGEHGLSFGWINRALFESGKVQPHMNVFGGEDRFWMGPEGGQFSIFFTKGAPFDLEHWFTPAAIDTMPFQLVNKSLDKAAFTASFGLTNYSGTQFDLKVERQVRFLDSAEAW